jgi:hypothetical protein
MKSPKYGPLKRIGVYLYKKIVGVKNFGNCLVDTMHPGKKYALSMHFLVIKRWHENRGKFFKVGLLKF